MRAWLIACLIAVFVSVPLLDEMNCQSEVVPAASGQTLADLHATTATDPHATVVSGADDDGGADVCLHGHCHHGQTSVTGTAVNIAYIAPVADLGHAVETSVLRSADLEHLKRPPRA